MEAKDSSFFGMAAPTPTDKWPMGAAPSEEAAEAEEEGATARTRLGRRTTSPEGKTGTETGPRAEPSDCSRATCNICISRYATCCIPAKYNFEPYSLKRPAYSADLATQLAIQGLPLVGRVNTFCQTGRPSLKTSGCGKQ